jgi:hypothetical protein
MFLPRRRQQPPPGSGLHQCPVCHAAFVIPLWWEERADNRLRLLLRCGECETQRDVEVSGDVARRFEQEYRRDLNEMAAMLEERIVADDFRF